jgi:hypothetical protein
MCEVVEVKVEVVLEVVVEEDMVGVNGKENLMYFDCIKYNPHFKCTEYNTNWVQEKYSSTSSYFILHIFIQVKDSIFNMLLKCHVTCCNIII